MPKIFTRIKKQIKLMKESKLKINPTDMADIKLKNKITDEVLRDFCYNKFKFAKESDEMWGKVNDLFRNQEKLDRYIDLSTFGKLTPHLMASYRPNKKFLKLWKKFEDQFKEELEARKEEERIQKEQRRCLKKFSTFSFGSNPFNKKIQRRK